MDKRGAMQAKKESSDEGDFSTASPQPVQKRKFDMKDEVPELELGKLEGAQKFARHSPMCLSKVRISPAGAVPEVCFMDTRSENAHCEDENAGQSTYAMLWKQACFLDDVWG